MSTRATMRHKQTNKAGDETPARVQMCLCAGGCVNNDKKQLRAGQVGQTNSFRVSPSDCRRRSVKGVAGKSMGALGHFEPGHRAQPLHHASRGESGEGRGKEGGGRGRASHTRSGLPLLSGRGCSSAGATAPTLASLMFVHQDQEDVKTYFCLCLCLCHPPVLKALRVRTSN